MILKKGVEQSAPFFSVLTNAQNNRDKALRHAGGHMTPRAKLRSFLRVYPADPDYPSKSAVLTVK
jgi:hypothetical protein